MYLRQGRETLKEMMASLPPLPDTEAGFLILKSLHT